MPRIGPTTSPFAFSPMSHLPLSTSAKINAWPRSAVKDGKADCWTGHGGRRKNLLTKEHSMKHLRRFAWTLLMAAGAAGLVLSLIAISGVHQASTSVSRHTTDILDSTKEGVAFVK